MKKIYDLAVKVGEYEKDGETKGRYENVGCVMKGDDGSFIIFKRTFNPAGVPNPDERDTVIVSMFEPKTDGQQQPAPKPVKKQPVVMDDDIPF